jgi:hypothetical protein
VRQEPEAQLIEVLSKDAEGELIQTQLESQAAKEITQGLATSLSSSTAHEDAAAHVLNEPVLGIGEMGTAATLEDAATRAPSSRLVLQALSEGLADFMRQDATFSVLELDALKVLAEQNVMTNYQLEMAVKQLVDQGLEELQGYRNGLEKSFVTGYREGQEALVELNDAFDQLDNLGDVELGSFWR